jgi:predicted nuclease of restriction endonuclease-like (RecB) superfamily
LYWQIAKVLQARQKVEAWGSKYLEQVSVDMKAAFPGMKGFSRTNLYNMRQFSQEYPDFSIVQQAVGQLGWGAITDLIQKVKSQEERDWYAQQVVKEGR